MMINNTILKVTFFIGVFIYAIVTNGQVTSTVAGTMGQPGNNDGQALNTATFNNPHGIALAKNGDVYIADRYNHLIRKIDVNGIVTTLAGTGISGKQDGLASMATFNEPWGLAVDTLGNVFVADTKNNKIRKITPSGIVSTFAGTGNFGITDANNPLAASFGSPTDVIFDKKGNLFVADHLTHLIRKISQNGTVSTLAGNKNYPNNNGLVDGLGQLAKFYRPYGIDIDTLGNLYVADEWNHAIRKISPLGVVTTIAGNGTIGSNNDIGSLATFNYPWDVAVDSTGKIYVSDGYNYTIRSINLDNKVEPFVGLLAQQGATNGLPNVATFNGATSIAFNKDFSALFVGDAYNHLIRKIIFTNSIDSPKVRFQSLSSTLDSISSCQNSKLELFIGGGYDSYDVYLDSSLLLTTTDPMLDLSSLPARKGSIYIVGKKDGYTSKSSNVLKYHIIASNPAKILANKPAPYCLGDKVFLYTNNKSNVVWNKLENNDSIEVKTTGKYYLTNDNTACYTNKDTVSILFHPKPTITVTKSKVEPFIEGESLYLIAGGAKNYIWNNVEKNDSLLITESGKHLVQGTDINTCTNYSDTIHVVFQAFKNTLKINFTKSAVFCSNDSIQITANIKSPVKWYLNNVLLLHTDSVLYVKKQGEYHFSYQPKNSTLPYYSDTVSIKSINPPIADIQSNIQIISELANKVHFDPGITTLTSYLWDFGDASFSNETKPTHEYSNPGNYTVKLSVEDINGCKANIVKSNFITYSPKIFIANAFTPNDDQINDEIIIRGVPNYANVNFKIFNEWGEEVFASTDTNASWNGNYKNEIANQGNYAYLLIVKINEVETVFKGIIRLIK